MWGYLYAASFAKPDNRLFATLRKAWTQRSKDPSIEPYHIAVVVNLMTLLQTFGVSLHNTFFEDVLKESANPQAAFVLRVSYLFHQITMNNAKQNEQQEFWDLLSTGGSDLEREWLELSGLMTFQRKAPLASTHQPDQTPEPDKSGTELQGPPPDPSPSNAI